MPSHQVTGQSEEQRHTDVAAKDPPNAGLMVGQHQGVDALRELLRWFTDTDIHLQRVGWSSESSHQGASRLALQHAGGRSRQVPGFLQQLPQQQLRSRQHHGAQPDNTQFGQYGLTWLYLWSLNGGGASGCMEVVNAQSTETERGHAQRAYLSETAERRSI